MGCCGLLEGSAGIHMNYYGKIIAETELLSI